MRLPDLVLVHGGLHAGDCWDLVRSELADRAPDLRVLAVDLPGRRDKPGDLATTRLADWADSVVADIDAAGFNDVVIVGHSMAGLTVPNVVARLGRERVREMVFVAAVIPRQGSSAVHSLAAPLVPVARLAAISRTRVRLTARLARLAFWHTMTREQCQMAFTKLCPESSTVIVQPVDRTDMPTEVPRTWIMPLRDRALSTRRQHDCIRALGGVETTIHIDTCHDVMFSEPARLAAILHDRCKVRASA